MTAKEDTHLYWEENVPFGAQIIAYDFSCPNLKELFMSVASEAHQLVSRFLVFAHVTPPP